MRLTNALTEAEAFVLNCCIGNLVQLQKAIDQGVARELFVVPCHRTIWDAMMKLADSGKNTDLLTIYSFLEARNELDGVGGMSGLAELGRYSYYVDLDRAIGYLMDLKQKRDIEEYAVHLMAMADDANVSSQEMLAEAERQMAPLRTCCGVQEAMTIRQAAEQVIDALEWRTNHPGEVRGLSSGFRKLDACLDGLQPGNMIVVAARPGIGKTSILTNMLTNLVFAENPVPCGMFSLEMSQTQLIERITFSHARINAAAIRRGARLTVMQQKGFTQVFKRIVKAPLYVDDRSALTIEQIQAKARRWVNEHGIRCIGVDYLQLAKASSQQAKFSREREVSEISAGLKAIAKELNIPVIVLAQLNREAEKRSGKKQGVPQVSDLRESGAIEQDADQILLLHRPHVYDPNANPEDAKLIIGKNRFGSLGYVQLTWSAALTRFEEAHIQPAE